MILGVGLSLPQVAVQGPLIPWLLDATAGAVRAAIRDPSSWGTTGSATGWLLPGTARLRMDGASRASATMARQDDGTYAWEPMNLLLRSGDLSNAAWTKDNATATSGKLTENAAAGTTYRAYQTYTSNGSPATFWVEAKAAERSWISLRLDPGTDQYAWFNLAAGTVGTVNAAYTAAITLLDDGYYRCEIRRAVVASGSQNAVISLATGDNVTTYTGDGASGALIRHSQVNLGLVASAKVVTDAAARFAPGVEHDGSAWRVQAYAQATNSVRNSARVGATVGVIGSGGAAPTNWQVNNNGNGLAREIVGVGMVGALPYIDIRFSGTPSSGAGCEILPEQITAIAAASGQTWQSSQFVALVGGSLANTTITHRVEGINAAGNAVTETHSTTITPTATLTRLERAGVLANGSTAFVRPNIVIAVTSGQAVDITLRIACPQLERDRVSPPTLTYGSTVTRTADAALALLPATLAQGTVVCDFTPPTSVAGVPVAGVFSVNDNTANERIDYRAGQAGSFITDGGVTQANLSMTATANVRNRVAVAWAANDFAGSINGGAVATDASGTVPTVNQIRIGSIDAGANELSGGWHRIRLLDRRLPNGRLQGLSA